MKKYYKEINKITFDFVFDNSPVEFIEATNFYDIDTFDYYLTLKMKNVSQRKIKGIALSVHLFLDNKSVPYKKFDYTYEFCEKEDNFLGEKEYIPIPQTFYKFFDIILKEVTYEDGTTEKYNVSSRKKGTLIKDMSKDIITACELVEESDSLKENFPAVVMPMFREKAWICCCAHKNSSDSMSCENCGRDKNWLIEAYDKSSLSKLAKEEGNNTLSMSRRAQKADFIAKKDFKPLDEKKEHVIEKEIKKVEKRERYKEKMRLQALPRFALYFVLAYLLYFLLRLLMETVLK